MQYRVPQNIDLEDKVIGPLTLIQFLYLLGGGVIDYLLFASLGSSIVFWILGIPIAIIALALALLKIQDQPLSHFITAALVYYSRPKERRWQREGQNLVVIKEPLRKKVEAPKIAKRQVNKSELEQLAYMLDTHNKIENPKS